MQSRSHHPKRDQTGQNGRQTPEKLAPKSPENRKKRAKKSHKKASDFAPPEQSEGGGPSRAPTRAGILYNQLGSFFFA